LERRESEERRREFLAEKSLKEVSKGVIVRLCKLGKDLRRERWASKLG
jgi:hypothetical protein